jgi:hypothetical protein
LSIRTYRHHTPVREAFQLSLRSEMSGRNRRRAAGTLRQDPPDPRGSDVLDDPEAAESISHSRGVAILSRPGTRSPTRGRGGAPPVIHPAPVLACAFRLRPRDSRGPRARRWSSGPGASFGLGGFPPRFAGDRAAFRSGWAGLRPCPGLGVGTPRPPGGCPKNSTGNQLRNLSPPFSSGRQSGSDSGRCRIRVCRLRICFRVAPGRDRP